MSWQEVKGLDLLSTGVTPVLVCKEWGSKFSCVATSPIFRAPLLKLYGCSFLNNTSRYASCSNFHDWHKMSPHMRGQILMSNQNKNRMHFKSLSSKPPKSFIDQELHLTSDVQITGRKSSRSMLFTCDWLEKLLLVSLINWKRGAKPNWLGIHATPVTAFKSNVKAAQIAKLKLNTVSMHFFFQGLWSWQDKTCAGCFAFQVMEER